MTKREALLFVVAFMVLAMFTILRPPVRHSYQPIYPTTYESPDEVNDYGNDFTVFTMKTDPNSGAHITISDMMFVAGCMSTDEAEALVAIIMPNPESSTTDERDNLYPEWRPNTSPITLKDLKVIRNSAPWEHGWKRTSVKPFTQEEDN